VPLLRAGFRPRDAYTVSFVIMHSGTPFAKKGGAELSLPRMDIPISLLRWEIFLPDRYKVKDFAGDALAIDRLPPGLLESPGLRSDELAGAAPVSLGVVTATGPLLPGQLGGTIFDASGAFVPGTRVTVTSAITGYTRTVVSDYLGQWRTSGIPSGQIKITAERIGFQKVVRTIDYSPGQPVPCNFVLQVGATTETVEVTGQDAEVPFAGRNERDAKKQAQQAQNAPSSNVLNLQRRVAGVLPVAIEVPHAGAAFHFVRPLVVDEETKVTFNYGSK
jgi:hypothetical protein